MLTQIYLLAHTPHAHANTIAVYVPMDLQP